MQQKSMILARFVRNSYFAMGSAIVALNSLVALAAESAIGSIGSLLGKATIVREGKSIPATKGMPIFASDSLNTEANAAVKLVFDDGGTFMAFEKASVKISEYSLKKEGGVTNLKSAFDIAKGKVRFFVKPDPNKKVDAKYKTSNAVMGIRGTSGFIDATNPNKTQLVVITGKVEVVNPKFPNKSVFVTPNLMTEVGGKTPPTVPKLAPANLVKNLNAEAVKTDANPNSFESKEEPANNGQPGEKKSIDEKPSQEKPSQDKPSQDKPVEEKKESGAAEPSRQPEEKQGAEKPVAEKSGGEKPQGDKQEIKSTKKAVFNPNGEQTLSVKDENLNNLQKEQKVFDVSAQPKNAPEDIAGKIAREQSKVDTAVLKTVNEKIQENTERAREAQEVLREKAVSAAEGASKQVKVKIVLPE
jgi:FecR protein